MASPTGEMTFWDHLDALRGVLLRVAAVMFVAAVGAFIAMPWVFDRFIMGPWSPDFPLYALFDRLAASCGVELDGAAAFRGVEVVSLELASQFFIHMSASCWLALVVAFPIIIYLLWGFVAPGLYPQEKRGVRRVFVFGNLMFYIGVAVGYCLVIPLTVRFLADYRLSESIGAIVSLDSYMDNFFTLLILMGAVFELPVVAWFLGKAGVLTRGFFSRYRRHAIVALLIVSALITPTGDPFTLAVVFFPIYALWELSAALVPKEKH